MTIDKDAFIGITIIKQQDGETKKPPRNGKSYLQKKVDRNENLFC